MRTNRWRMLSAVLFLAISACTGPVELAVSQEGQSQYQIVIRNDPSPVLKYAAAELQTFLQETLGVQLPIVTERQAGRGPAFLLGPSKLVRAGLIREARTLGEDGVLLKTAGKNIVLLGGGERGQLYSVYVFLERYLGCRFLARDCSVAPKRPELKLPKIDYRYTPPFIYRETLYHDAGQWDFAARQRLNGSNMNQVLGLPWGEIKEIATGILIFPFAHSACYMVPPDKYFADHPEYFGLVNGKRQAAVISGQLCYTNPDVLKICIDETLKLFKDHPEIASVDISQNDSWPDRSGACECEKCTAIVKEEEAQHGPILRFVNAVADAVAEKYPGKYIDTLAYSYAIAAPKFTKPRDNVIIRLCHFACYFHGIEGEELGAEYRKAIEDWRRVAKNVFVWHYGTNFWNYLAPNPNLTALAKDIKYYVSHGINGLMVQGDIQSSGGELAEFRQYLVSQLMWDPTLDPITVRTDFCRGYYGPAADDALEFLGLMDSSARAMTKHIPMNGWKPPDVTTAEFVSNGLSILNRALAKAPDDVIRNRVEKLLLPLWFVQLSWPDLYGLSKEDGRTVLARFRNVAKANSITTISEGPPDLDNFVARMEAMYRKPGGHDPKTAGRGK